MHGNNLMHLLAELGLLLFMFGLRYKTWGGKKLDNICDFGYYKFLLLRSN
jgi:hypothetical protein